MKILFEEYIYEIAQIESLLSERYYIKINTNQCKINYVGYCFDAQRNEVPTIILPKVFINEKQQVFGEFSPIDLLFLNENKSLQLKLRKDKKLDFLFNISTWLYLAIKRFNARNTDSVITDSSDLNQVISNLGRQDISELEIVKSMISFNHENQQLFTFIKKTNSSQNKKTNWAKTINRKIAYFQDENPFYFETLAKQKTINYDEQLLIIFFSVLESFNKKYFLKIPINPLFKTMNIKEFSVFMRNGTKVLKQIKYKYFNDKLLKMWHLLHIFCERAEQIKANKNYKEILLAKDFNIIFEDMVDSLLAEENLPKKLKEQNDGKVVDHIYPYQDLLTGQDLIYHIADSKYYGANTAISHYDRAKQYTYAKNVIQYNIDWLNDSKNTKPIRYRDELTEGYNITPNFFIRAFVDKNLDFKQNGLEFKDNFKRNTHFLDRLFDRDTLILQAYNINFLRLLDKIKISLKCINRFDI